MQRSKLERNFVICVRINLRQVNILHNLNIHFQIQISSEGKCEFVHACCVACLEGLNTITCTYCSKYWQGSHLTLGWFLSTFGCSPIKKIKNKFLSNLKMFYDFKWTLKARLINFTVLYPSFYNYSTVRYIMSCSLFKTLLKLCFCSFAIHIPTLLNVICVRSFFTPVVFALG